LLYAPTTGDNLRPTCSRKAKALQLLVCFITRQHPLLVALVTVREAERLDMTPQTTHSRRLPPPIPAHRITRHHPNPHVPPCTVHVSNATATAVSLKCEHLRPPSPALTRVAVELGSGSGLGSGLGFGFGLGLGLGLGSGVEVGFGFGFYELERGSRIGAGVGAHSRRLTPTASLPPPHSHRSMTMVRVRVRGRERDIGVRVSSLPLLDDDGAPTRHTEVGERGAISLERLRYVAVLPRRAVEQLLLGRLDLEELTRN